jgi:hypothetical protein
VRTTGAFSWGVLLCKLSDHQEEPRSAGYFRDLLLNHSSGGISDYWSDMSYGALDMSGGTIYGWVGMDITTADFMKLSRWDKTQRCVAAVIATLDITQLMQFSLHDGLICITNASVADGGRTGNRVLLDADAWRHTFIAHETGHVIGLDHSFDIRTFPWDPVSDGRAGAYGDGRDIMSAETFGAQQTVFDGLFGNTGPGLCALTREKLGWLESSRITEMSVVPGEDWNTQGNVSAVDNVTARGNPMYRITADGRWNNQAVERIVYTIEFRPRVEWDAGLPGDAVTIRMMRPGDVARITWSANGTQDWHVGEHFFDEARRLAIDVMFFAGDRGTASVAIAAGARAGHLRNWSVAKSLGPRYDLTKGLRAIVPRPPFPANSVRARLLDNPPQLEGA